jgi:type VI secretion system secreted protein VgrG
MELGDIWSVLKSFSLSEANRPVRMRLAHGRGMLDDVLMVQRVEGKESVGGGLEYRLFCVCCL